MDQYMKRAMTCLALTMTIAGTVLVGGCGKNEASNATPESPTANATENITENTTENTSENTPASTPEGTTADTATSAVENKSATESAQPTNQLHKNATVSYLGPAGTYTEEATQLFFGEEGKLSPKDTVVDAIADVVSGESEYAVIPQENTLGGAVTDYVDALIAEESVYVVGEVVLPISQTLMGIEGTTLEDIKTVCSHAQGIKQSEQWRSEHLPDAVTEEMASTAAAASYVAEQGDKTIAAVAAPGAAKLYGLTVLAENVQITDANKTRFYVLSKAPLSGEQYKHAAFVADCEANQIDDIIVTIHDAGLELVTIHDRPEGSALGKYNYIIETMNENGVKKAQTDEIEQNDAVRFLGSFDTIEK